MKIVKKDNYVCFGSLGQGAVFIDAEDEVMMKIDPIVAHQVTYNAVSLETGATFQLANEAKVLSVPASVTVTI